MRPKAEPVDDIENQEQTRHCNKEEAVNFDVIDSTSWTPRFFEVQHFLRSIEVWGGDLILEIDFCDQLQGGHNQKEQYDKMALP